MNTSSRLAGGYTSLGTCDHSEKDVPSATSSFEDGIDNATPKQRESSRFRGRFFLFLHGALFALNILVAWSYAPWTSSVCSHGPQHQDSAARDVIQYEGKKFELAGIYQGDGSLNPKKPTSFNGPPRPDLDKAWDDLIGVQNIRLQRAEMDQFAHDDTLIKLKDGSGYWTTMSVFHGLHCVKRLHHYIHKDVYYANLTSPESQRLLEHTEHCLDWLRQYVQCNADTTLIPLHWTPSQRLPIALDNGNHQCVKWGRFSDWVEEHSFDPRKPGLVVHPSFGDVLGSGQDGDSIGITTFSEVIHGD